MEANTSGGLKYVRAINLLGVIILALTGIFLAMIAVPNFARGGDDASSLLLLGVGLVSVLIAWVPAFLILLLNKGLAKCKPMARNIQIGLSVLGLLSFPIGTVLHGISLYFLLFDETTKALFVQEEDIFKFDQGLSMKKEIIFVAVVVLGVLVLSSPALIGFYVGFKSHHGWVEVYDAHLTNVEKLSDGLKLAYEYKIKNKTEFPVEATLKVRIGKDHRNLSNASLENQGEATLLEKRLADRVYLEPRGTTHAKDTLTIKSMNFDLIQHKIDDIELFVHADMFEE